MNALHFFFGICGNVTVLLLLLAPMMTFKRILKNKSTEQFSGLPYVMNFHKCLFSTWYGLPFVSPNNILLATFNVTDVVIETIYILVFLFIAPRKEKIKIGGLFASGIFLFAATAITSVIAFEGNKRKLFVGLVTSIIGVIMFGSPLSVMMMVIETRSVEYMPFLLSLFIFLGGASWLIFGLLGHDLFIFVANAIGCGLGAMQLILYFIYYDKNDKSGPGSSESRTTADNALDTGDETPQQTHENVKKPDDSTTIGGLNGHV